MPLMILEKSSTNNKNRSGPITNSWGIPLLILVSRENASATCILIVFAARQDLIHKTAFSHRSIDSSSANKNSWLIYPNAVVKSKFTTASTLPSPINRVTVTSSTKKLERHERQHSNPAASLLLHCIHWKRANGPRTKTLHTAEVRLTGR